MWWTGKKDLTMGGGWGVYLRGDWIGGLKMTPEFERWFAGAIVWAIVGLGFVALVRGCDVG